MKDTLYIAVTGVHGSGKTTLCERLKHAIRREMGLDVVVGAEVARDCPYPVGLETSREAQDWIYDAHKRMELELRMESHDVVIFDRTMLDNVVYAMRYIGIRGGYLDLAFTDQMEEAQGCLHNHDYDLVIRTHLVPLRPSDDPVFTRQMEGLFDVFMSPFVDVDVGDVRESNVAQTTVEWVEDIL
jgi:nicotinamide riboside kinase